jgi:hypothetical protein
VYQIGEVQARSWVIMGTLSGISMPKRLASQAVQPTGIRFSRDLPPLPENAA